MRWTSDPLEGRWAAVSSLMCLAIFTLALTGCPEFSRSKIHLTYELDSGFLNAPAISAYLQSDGFDDCLTDEDETDYGLLYFFNNFNTSISGLKFQPFAACSPLLAPRYFVEKEPETVYEIGDNLAGCFIGGTFETRLAGRWAMSAGFCNDGTDAVIVSERTGANSWTHNRVVGTGTQIGSSVFDRINGVDFRWTGLEVSLALSYTDSLSQSWLAYCPNLVCEVAVAPGDISGAVEYFSPKIGGFSPNAYLAFQANEAQFDPPTRLYYADTAPTTTRQLIAQVGDTVLPGETIQSFGSFLSHEAGDDFGAFIVRTMPSDFSVALTYDVTDNLSLWARYQTNDDAPDTTETVSTLMRPAFDGNYLSLQIQTNTFNSLFVNELHNLSGGMTDVGYGRTGTEAFVDYELNFTQSSNDRVVDGIAAFGASLSSIMGGTFQAVAIQNVERVEVVRGGAEAIYGADAIAGVVNFLTGPETGFDVEVKGGTVKDFGGATFNKDDIFFMGSRVNGDFYFWNDVTEREEFLGDTEIPGGFTGLAVDENDTFWAVNASALWTFDRFTFPATLVGTVLDDQAQPVTDLSGLAYRDGRLAAARQSGELGELNPLTATYTPRFAIRGLPSTLESISGRGMRVYGGLFGGRLIEILDCLPPDGGGGAATTEFGFTVLGRRGTSPLTALAVVPEPSTTALGFSALCTIAVLRRIRAARRDINGWP